MTKKEAIEAMRLGKRVRHRYFSDSEWMKQSFRDYEFEDGVKCSPDEFWRYREDKVWEEDWEIVEPTIAEFNELRSRDKWDFLKKHKSEMNGSWHCGGCDIKLDEEPYRASPFDRSSVHCDNCDFELTRRTGGGQCDPMNWVYKG